MTINKPFFIHSKPFYLASTMDLAVYKALRIVGEEK